MINKTLLSRELTIAFGLLSLTATDFALAQQTPQRVEITGSNIRRVDAETLQPVQIITRDEIERSGKSNLNDVLRDLPAVNGGGFNEGTGAGNSFAPGTSSISLRGLGANTSLILLNGRRIANYGFAQSITINFVDLNSIPVNAIDRIEVLKDGASAIYGSDAIGGVVNVILRRDFKGGEIRGSFGDSQQGGLTQRRGALSLGRGDLAKDRFNVMATLDYFKQDRLNSQQREFAKNPDNRTQGPGGLDFRSPTGNPGYFSVSSTGVRQAFSTCPADRTVGASTLGVSGSGTVCAYDFGPDNDLLPASERIGILASGTFQLNKNVQLFAEFLVNRNETSNSAAPTPAAFVLGAAHPDKPAAAFNQVAYRFLDAGLRLSTIESESQRALFGARGTLGAWDFDSAVVSSSSKQTNTGFNYIIQERANEAFLGTLAGFTGKFYRVLDPTLNPTAMVDAIKISPVRTGDSKLMGVDAKATRELFKMAGGTAGLAVGVDFRKEEVTDSPDPRVDVRNPTRVSVAGSGGTFVKGDRNISSAYAEVSLPFAKGVDSQVAVRTDRYSDFGSATTPKLGVSYRPMNRVLFRASYAEGFRAPSMAEAYLGESVSFPSVVDTVRCAAYKNGPLGSSDPRTRAICGYNATTGVVGSGVASQVRTSVSGNPTLQPENSKSATFGLVVDPTRDFSMSVDGYYIEHNNRILSASNAYILQNFPAFVKRFDPSADDIAAGAPGGLRGVSGDTVSGINNTYFNASSQFTLGFDFEVRYRWTLGNAGLLSLTSATTYIDSLKRQLNPGQPNTQLANTFDYPSVRNSTSLLWARGHWATTLGMNYVSSMEDVRFVAGAPVMIPSFTTYDVNVTYRGFKNMAVSVGGRNVTNKNPPFSNLDWYGYAPGTHSPVGAYWYASARYQF